MDWLREKTSLNLFQSQTNTPNPLLPFLNDTDQNSNNEDENNTDDEEEDENEDEENDENDVHVIPIHPGI